MINKLVAVLVLLVMCSCTTVDVTRTHYDSDGKVTLVEESKVTTPVEYGKLIGDILGSIGSSFLAGYADKYADKMFND
jgi:hypothetical protein